MDVRTSELREYSVDEMNNVQNDDVSNEGLSN
jgi:hypothetical protein